jgi:hypothetical protein
MAADVQVYVCKLKKTKPGKAAPSSAAALGQSNDGNVREEKAEVEETLLAGEGKGLGSPPLAAEEAGGGGGDTARTAAEYTAGTVAAQLSGVGINGSACA